MALADYYGRGAQAASQVLAGFDAAAFEQHVRALEVGVAFGPDVVESTEGPALLDLLVRLLARFYPAVTFTAPEGALRDSLAALARSINPQIEISSAGRPRIGVVVGTQGQAFRRSIFAGCDGWTGSAGTAGPLTTGASTEAVGAGIAACLATALLFRVAVVGQRPRRATETLDGALFGEIPTPRGGPFEAVLVGCGAIGNAVAWTMARSPDRGRLLLVDPEAIERSNLQRYVLAQRDDEAAAKVDVVRRFFSDAVRATAHRGDWQSLVADRGYDQSNVAVALDSAEDRRAVQASLPRTVVNGWTQPGDLGVSSHSVFGGDGACLACLYLPAGRGPNEDEIYARALGIPDRLADVRTLLHTEAAVGEALIAMIATALARPLEVLAPFSSRPIRDLYVRGICGGEVLPLGSTRSVRADVHVPLAHQSALAGVLLAARLTEALRRGQPTMTHVTQLDVLRPIQPYPTHAEAAREGCICRDIDFVARYRSKWHV
ncbi:MAG TPA: E2 ligase fold family C protein [Candidatus Dormibacteraeota bacterium]|nr:E2 ligase fold family C protein [Candidatus Dormibacteraeota bacterium]